MNEKQVRQVSKMLGILVEHLPEFFRLKTEDVQWVIQNPKEAITLFVEAIKRRIPGASQIWKTIELGTKHRNAQQFCRALQSSKCKVSEYAKYFIESSEFTVSPKIVKLNLVKVSIADLGLSPEGLFSIDRLYERAISMGLKPLPVEAGVQLRLQYMDQPPGECLIVAIELSNYTGGNVLFTIAHNSYLRLATRKCISLMTWNPNSVFVFALPQ